ncbi:MAG: DUF11 domain-containing protein, partial [Holophagales bacterium]|nr:DUF11 domain-containing protein [Holophagales bacterium]
GPALFVGGEFGSAGGVGAENIARWDGSTWSAVGGGVASWVNAFAVFDDGSGGGPALYAAGRFLTAGGVPATRIARWDGTGWSPLGAGLSSTVESLAVFDDGGGEALYAGGWFTTAGGTTANRVARWDGAAWSAVGTGMDDAVESLVVYDDGGGGALYAGGRFTTADGSPAQRLARWNGSGWAEVGMGVNSVVSTLTVFDDGSGAGPALYAGGWFTFAHETLALRVARWDGSAWSALGAGTNGHVDALLGFDHGSGPVFYAGGQFTDAGEVGAAYLARWDGATWSALSNGEGGVNDSIRTFAVFDDGGGPDLYAGGDFTSAGGSASSRVARWDGSTWTNLGGGLTPDVRSLAVYDDGTGPALYALTRGELWKWDGASWSSIIDFVGTGNTLEVFDDGTGPALHVGGELVDLSQQLVDLYVGIWDGTTWSQSFYSLEMGGGEPEDEIRDLVGFEGRLHAGGHLQYRELVIGQDQRHDWSDAGTGLTGHPVLDSVSPLAVFDDGGGPSLYAGGSFTTRFGPAANFLAELVDGQWAPLPAETDGPVEALTVFDDGQGAGLYAGGSFAQVGTLPASRIARWDGAAWSALGAGIGGTVRALEAFDDGTGTSLYAGGSFVTAGGISSAHIAAWRCPTASPPNVAMTLTNGADEVFAGDAITYTVTVRSDGPVDVPWARLESLAAPSLGCMWKSFGTGGASGYSKGSAASIDDVLVLPAASQVTYTVTCRLPSDASGTLTHSVSLTAPRDGNPGDDAAADQDPIVEN